MWIAPVALAVLAMAGLAFAFRRWRPTGIAATDDDRLLVAAAVAARADAADSNGVDAADDDV